MTIKSFRDFKITTERRAFTGDKIKVEKVLNIEIIVHTFKIEPSKVKPGTELLTLQIEKQGTRHILWTSSVYLMDAIRKVPADGFPFTTTIIKQDEHLDFT